MVEMRSGSLRQFRVAIPGIGRLSGRAPCRRCATCGLMHRNKSCRGQVPRMLVRAQLRPHLRPMPIMSLLIAGDLLDRAHEWLCRRRRD
jgi:hypothetical protein